MRKGSCGQCGGAFGLNDLYVVFGETLCKDCANRRLEGVDGKAITGEAVHRLSDPTVCARCGADNGQVEFATYLEMPLCDGCREHIQHYPFPLWIKAACVGLAAVVIFTLVWNARFFRARVLMDQALKMGPGDTRVMVAAEKMQRAAQLVPESADLTTLAHYLSGMAAMYEERYADAVASFAACRDAPEGLGIGVWRLRAEAAQAFDKKDYREFFRLSQKLRDANPNEPIFTAQMASAYACLYAVDGRQADKQKALDMLKRAEDLGAANAGGEFEEYKERILHRLETRQILSKKEYEAMKGITKAEDAK